MSIDELPVFIEAEEFLGLVHNLEDKFRYSVSEEQQSAQDLVGDRDSREYTHRVEIRKRQILDSDKPKYALEFRTEYKHERGSGGFWHHLNTLYAAQDEASPLLQSSSSLSWTTLSDDSEDYSGNPVRRTKLFQVPIGDTFVKTLFTNMRIVSSK